MNSGRSARGLCVACEREMSLKRDGLLRGHGWSSGDGWCPGSWSYPETVTEDGPGAAEAVDAGALCTP